MSTPEPQNSPPGEASRPNDAKAEAVDEEEAEEEEEEEEEAAEEEEMTIEDDDQLMATTESGEIVEMVPCALLEDGELVELQDASGKTAYIALDGAVTDESVAAGAQGLIYYATPYAGDIEGLEPYAAGTANGPHSKAYLAGDRLAGSRAETPEEVKTQKEKTIARVVMAVACTLLTLCVVLVGVTLSMSEHINDMGECCGKLT